VRDERGVVLIYMLWVAALVGLLVLWAGQRAREAVGAAEGFLRLQRARRLALSGLSEAMVRLTVAESSKRWAPDGVPRTIEMEGAKVTVVIEPEYRKININRVKEDVLKEVLGELGLGEELAEAILDFRDRDNAPRPKGAEEEFYQTLNPPYRPINRPFQAPEELLWVRGVDYKALYGGDHPLVDLLSPWGGRVAPPEEGEEPETDLRPGRLYRISSSALGLTLVAVVRYQGPRGAVFTVRYLGEHYAF